MIDLLRKTIQSRLIDPIIHSVAPVKALQWGTAIGLLLGFTPTVGIQMYSAAVVWALGKYIFRFAFNLPVCIAMIWISNPLTMIPMYYGFLITGGWVQGVPTVTYSAFSDKLAEILAMESFWDSFIEGSKFLLIELGQPMLVGSMVYAVPISIGGFFAVGYFLTRHRKHKARQANMSYEEWCAFHGVAP
jgi:uncharacterized protein (DUF2062 family)